MKTLTVRKVPDDVYARLTDWAKTNHRSLQEQVRHLLEEEVKLHETGIMEAAANYRTRLEKQQLTDVVEDLRGDRKR